jgi:hypothetical protein
MKMAVFWVVATCSLVEVYRRFRGTCSFHHQAMIFARGLLIALMTGAKSTSETSVNVYQTTRRNNPEDSHLHTRRLKNLNLTGSRTFFTFDLHF